MFNFKGTEDPSSSNPCDTWNDNGCDVTVTTNWTILSPVDRIETGALHTKRERERERERERSKSHFDRSWVEHFGPGTQWPWGTSERTHKLKVKGSWDTSSLGYFGPGTHRTWDTLVLGYNDPGAHRSVPTGQTLSVSITTLLQIYANLCKFYRYSWFIKMHLF